MHRKRNIAVLGAIIGCAALAVGCGGNKTQQASTTNTEGNTTSAPSGQSAADRNMALVRFVNAIPGASVNLTLGGAQAFTAVPYKTVTPYKELSAKADNFKLTEGHGSESGGVPVANNGQGLSAGAHYTVVAMLDKKGKQKLNVITDNLAEPQGGEAKIRVINASTREVNVYEPATTGTANRARRDRTLSPPPPANTGVGNRNGELFTGVDSDSSTDYKNIAPVNGTLQVQPASGNARVRRRQEVKVPVQMTPGRLYTLVVTGGEHGHGLDVVKIADDLTAPNPMATQNGNGQ